MPKVTTRAGSVREAEPPDTVLDPDDVDEPEDPDDFDDPDDGDDDPEDPAYADRAPVRPIGRQAKVFESAFEAKKPYPFQIKAWVVDPETGDISIDEDGEPQFETHEFTARGNPGAGGMLAMGSLVRVDPHGRTLADAAAIMVFFERVLIPKDWSRFYELVVDRTDQQVQMEDLGAVYSWLVKEYGGRPTRPSSPSSNGASRRGRTSKARRR